MRIPKLIATAALMLGALGLTPAANAQRHDGRGDHSARSDHRGEMRRAPSRHRIAKYRGHRPQRHCRTIWRNHHRQRVCR